MPRPLTDDEAAVVEQHLPLVEHFLRGRHCDDATRDDLRAAGYLGLCHAIRLYDPAIAQWSTYASRWIRRCMQEETRSRMSVHIPAYHLSNLQGGTNPASKKRYGPAADRILAARSVQWSDGEAVAVLAITPPGEPCDERYRIIEDYLRDLPAPEQAMVRRTIMEGERVADVARDLGISDTRASQIRARAIRILRLRLAEEWPEMMQP